MSGMRCVADVVSSGCYKLGGLLGRVRVRNEDDAPERSDAHFPGVLRGVDTLTLPINRNTPDSYSVRNY